MTKARQRAETPDQSEARKLRDQLLGALKSPRAKLLFRRGRYLSFADFVGLMLAKLDEIMELVVYQDAEGDDKVDFHAAAQLARIGKLLLDGLSELRDELQDVPDSVEYRWTDFDGLPDVTPEIPARLDDLFEGVLTKRAEAERHKLRPAK